MAGGERRGSDAGRWWLFRYRISRTGLSLDARNETGKWWRLGTESAKPFILRTSEVDWQTFEVHPDLPGQLRESAPGTAVFVDPPPELRAQPWLAMTRRIASQLGLSDPTPVRLSRRSEWRVPEPLRPPLRVLTVGVDYYPEREAKGLVLTESAAPDEVEPADIARADVVLVDGDHIHRVLPNAGAPRCVVAVKGTQDPIWKSMQAPPRGCALVWISGNRALGPVHAPHALDAFFDALLADQPLHRAARDIQLYTGPPEIDQGVWLVADPGTNHGLRLADALGDLSRFALDLDSGTAPGDHGGFLKRVGDRATPLLTRQLLTAHDNYGSINKSLLMFYGSAESPMAEGLQLIQTGNDELASAAKVANVVHDDLLELYDDKETVELIREHQERVANVTLERTDWLSVFQGVTGRPESLWLGGANTLRRGELYRMRVRIGQPNRHSLVTGEQPAIDPMLPAADHADGHDLDITVFGIDFDVENGSRRTVRLPELGASEIATFDIRPHDDPKLDLARLRVGIFYRTNLLQSLLLEARVAEEEETSTGVELPLQVRVEFSATDRFADVPDTPERTLAVGLNESRGTHTVWTMGREREADTTFPAEIVDEHVKDFRELMREATYVNGGARFSSSPNGTPNSDDFSRYMTKLAKRGRLLWSNFLASNPGKFGDELRRVARSHDETIQVLWHNPAYAFPWAAIYDFRPPEAAADSLPDVCLGGADGGPPKSDPPVKECDHGPESDPVMCAYGFWGVRHRVENLLPSHDRLSRRNVVANGSGSPISVAIGVRDQHTSALLKRLQDDCAGAVAQVPDTADLVDHMWSTERPAVVVVVGHYDTYTVPDVAATYPRIEVVPQAVKYLTFKDVDSKLGVARWQGDPNSLVMLMACGSADLSIGTLNSLTNALTAAGANGVVGTECDVFSSLVSRFAAEVTCEMWGPEKRQYLSAITDFRRRLINEQNPLGFAFTPFGRAELEIEHA